MRLSSVSTAELSLGDSRFKDDYEVVNCDAIADDTGHVLLSTGNRKVRLTMLYMRVLWREMCGKLARCLCH